VSNRKIVREADSEDENPPEKGPAPHPGHQFSQIRNVGKPGSENIPSIIGDGPVSVRGPDERRTAEDTQYVLAVFQYKDKDRAQQARNDLLSGKFGISVPKVDGPRVGSIGGDPEKKFYSLSATVDIPDDTAPNELIRTLRGRRAADVRGPFKRAGHVRYELTVQKRSGATETLFFNSKDEAEAGKKQIEQGIRDNPVKGIAARRVAAGQSALTQRGLTKGQYFSDKASQARAHLALMKSDPEGARAKIADQLGLTLALDPAEGPAGEDARMERMILQQKHGQEKMRKMAANAKEQLDDYIRKLKDHAGGMSRTTAELDKLKPQFPGGFVGQVHTVKGRAQRYSHRYIDPKTGEEKKGGGWREAKSSHEFVWDGEEWLTPVEYTSKRRGEALPTRQAKKGDEGLPDVTPAGTQAVGGDTKGPEKRPSAKRLDPAHPQYAEHYAKTLEAVGRHYMKSHLTKDMGEAMLAVVRTTRSKGSPTRQSLKLLSDKIDDLKEMYETGGESLTPRGKENVQYALHAGYLCLRQPPPTHDDYSDDFVGGQEADPDFARSAAKAARLGFAKGANQPKSIGKDFKGDPRLPGRKHVAVAPGLPPAVVDKIPREYLRSDSEGWEELDYMLRGADDSEFSEPKDSSAWSALRKSLATPRKGDPADLKRSMERPWGPTRPPKKDSKGVGGDKPKDVGANADTPWRALAKLKDPSFKERGALDDPDEDDDEV
jgi:hypothetical protein